MKLMYSFKYAFRGIRIAWREGVNFRIHVIAAFLLIVFLFYFHFSYLEAALMIGAAALVLFGELVNTALEHMLDILEPRHHPLVGKMKDVTAAAVLIASFGALIAGILVGVHHFVK